MANELIQVLQYIQPLKKKFNLQKYSTESKLTH